MNFIGMDGGGTKTLGVIADHTGRVLASHTVGGTNPNGVGADQMQKELAELFSRLLDTVPLPEIAGCFAGMAGVDHPVPREKARSAIERLLPGVPVEVDNDGMNALYSGSDLGVGVAYISGTGSICIALGENGERVRVGGWGYLLGDEGSGYDFGRRALEAVMKDYDGRVEAPLLKARVLAHFDCERPADLIPIIYERGLEKSRIASVAPLLFEAYHEGEPAARKILSDALMEMRAIVYTALRRLGETGVTRADIVLAGTVFRSQPFLVRELQEQVEVKGMSLAWTVPDNPPVAGAVAKAVKNGLGMIPLGFRQGFKETFARG